MEIKDFKDKHKGERCFIIGTGPSLNKTNLSLLKDEICIGMNTLYRGLKNWGFTCRYYAVSDPGVWYKIYKELLKIDSIFFISQEIYNTYPDTIDYNKCLVINTIYGYAMWAERVFATKLHIGKVNGDSILICALQYAFYMGFKKVYIVGCDWSLGHYNNTAEPDTTKEFLETGDYKYSMNQKLRFKKATASCEICKKAYESHGREIINCTKNGNLNVFIRKDLEEIMIKEKVVE